MSVLDETTTREVTERFAALEAERGQTYEGRVELAREGAAKNKEQLRNPAADIEELLLDLRVTP